MTLPAPTYGIGNIVYIRESAALGFLEAYAVEGVEYTSDGSPLYTLVSSLRAPNVAQTMGDRVTGQRLLPVKFLEHDLILYCDALELASISLRSQLDSIESLRVLHGCVEDETSGDDDDTGTG